MSDKKKIVIIDDEQNKQTTIVFVTAIAVPMVFLAALMENETLRQKAGPVGGYYFIQKPINPQELISRLDEIINAKP